MSDIRSKIDRIFEGYLRNLAQFGKYAPLRNKPSYQIPEIGLNPTAGTDVRVLSCGHCGHVEIFQFNGIANRDSWNK